MQYIITVYINILSYSLVHIFLSVSLSISPPVPLSPTLSPSLPPFSHSLPLPSPFSHSLPFLPSLSPFLPLSPLPSPVSPLYLSFSTSLLLFHIRNVPVAPFPTFCASPFYLYALSLSRYKLYFLNVHSLSL